jgi:hypothetical protein
MFSDDPSGNGFGDGIPLSPHQTLVFDHVVTNAGNGYDPQTGFFTAPVAGYYAFSIVIMEPNGATHPDLSVEVVKNGAIVDMAYVHNEPSDLTEQGSTHAVVHLAAGDRVWIRQHAGDGIRGSVWTVFTGYLVHVD